MTNNEFETSTMSMEDAASLFAPLEESKSPDETGTALVAPSKETGVYAEPIITAQPCQIKRNVPNFLQKMKALAQMAGEDYCYRFPVKSKDGSKKFIEGPTIIMANDMAREYMNCMVDVRAVDSFDSILFYARFIDYETGFCMTRAFRQRKGQKTMNTDAERAADIVFQIGQSKAIRNVVVNALQTYADYTYREAKASLVTQIGQKLEEWREKMKAGIKQKGYDLKRIEASIGNTIDKWLAPDIARVIAELKSIADGMASFEDMYPDPNAKPEQQTSGNEGVKEKMRGKRGPKPKEESPPAPEEQEPAQQIKEVPEPDLSTQESIKASGDSLVFALMSVPPAVRSEAFVKMHGPMVAGALKQIGQGLVIGKLRNLGIKLPE